MEQKKKKENTPQTGGSSQVENGCRADFGAVVDGPLACAADAAVQISWTNTAAAQAGALNPVSGATATP